jgi:diacylglycerol kinase family enzyme
VLEGGDVLRERKGPERGVKHWRTLRREVRHCGFAFRVRVEYNPGSVTRCVKSVVQVCCVGKGRLLVGVGGDGIQR